MNQFAFVTATFKNEEDFKAGNLQLSRSKEEFKPRQNYFVLMLNEPRFDRMGRTEAAMDAAATMLKSMSLSKKSYSENTNEDGMDIETAVCMRKLGDFIEYFMNSGSYRAKAVKEYDIYEFQKRIKDLSGSFERASNYKQQI